MKVPGPRSRELAQALRRVESRNVTYVDERLPVFWESAHGATVVDVDGNRFTDLTAGFGVANAGHGNAAVAAAIAHQAGALMHAMGDVHPARVKADLLDKLAQIAPAGLGKTFLASTGAEAIEAAIKTAIVATGKSSFAAFRGAYHGLSLGTLEVGGIEKFRKPFRQVLPNRAVLLDFPREGDDADAHLEIARRTLEARDDLAALLIEPIQARGGHFVPPRGYVRGLRDLCTSLGILLIFDEIYTGFGRTGSMFACMAEDAVPDILCIGKALGNGFPISAAIASPSIMDAWPESPGEALHTSTYLGNPMACAAAIATIGEVERLRLPQRAAALGSLIEPHFEQLRANGKIVDVRGRGLMWGLELRNPALAARAVKDALAAGVIVVQAGAEGNVLSVTPPLVIGEEELLHAIDILAGCLSAP